jgi:hypothetical protein
MKKFLLAAALIFIGFNSRAQIAKDLMLGVSADLIKSDYDEFFHKFQSGVEINYFLSRKFTVTGGLEYWSRFADFSVVMGARYYPIPEAFLRVRGFIGANDLALGGGWAKPINKSWKFEAMADFYFEGSLAIRAGFVYIIRRKHEAD